MGVVVELQSDNTISPFMSHTFLSHVSFYVSTDFHNVRRFPFK